MTCCGPFASRDALLFAVGAASAIATLAGGLVALGVRRFAETFAAIAGGAMTAVALLDLLPQALHLARPAYTTFDVLGALTAGFAAYLLVDRLASKASAGRGRFAAASLTGHSLLDGLGVGLSFQVSVGAGIVVAAAVLAHDIIDGLSTVAASRSGGAKRFEQAIWLLADAIAPLAGILLSTRITVAPTTLALVLAVFAGFFLFIGARELVGHGEGDRSRLSTAAAGLAGFGLVWGAILIGRG